jgi:hypothetical protein
MRLREECYYGVTATYYSFFSAPSINAPQVSVLSVERSVELHVSGKGQETVAKRSITANKCATHFAQILPLGWKITSAARQQPTSAFA